MKLKVVFSLDSSGYAPDITEEINISDNICLYCLHDHQNRLLKVVCEELENKGYDIKWYIQIMKVYTIPLDKKTSRLNKLEQIFS